MSQISYLLRLVIVFYNMFIKMTIFKFMALQEYVNVYRNNWAELVWWRKNCTWF